MICYQVFLFAFSNPNNIHLLMAWKSWVKEVCFQDSLNENKQGDVWYNVLFKIQCNFRHKSIKNILRCLIYSDSLCFKYFCERLKGWWNPHKSYINFGIVCPSHLFASNGDGPCALVLVSRKIGWGHLMCTWAVLRLSYLLLHLSIQATSKILDNFYLARLIKTQLF